jgi:hypothetical protein
MEYYNQHSGPNPEIGAFIEKAITYEGDECLIWPFAKSGDGYAYLSSGHFKRRYKTGYVSKAVCIETYGPPPTFGHQAAHLPSCISKACINRKHLRWATPKENIADDCRGEDHYNSKLTNQQVLEIRQLANNMTNESIAQIYKVSKSRISAIIRNETWAWLANPDFQYNGPDLFG